jgi:hypothetical protein
MNMPGFTAGASLKETIGPYQWSLTSSFAIGAKANEVLMQKPNSENTPGGKCYGKAGPDIIQGTYDSKGRCCGPHGGWQVCVDCDTDKCFDRASRFVSRFTSGDFLSGVFAPF